MPPKPTIPPTLETDLQHYPWIVIRFRCDYCRRWGDAGLAACAEKYGARITLAELLGIFISGCVWRPDLRKPQKYGRKCGAYIADLRRTDPPDLPPAAMGIRLIEGGKDDMLPAEPEPPRERRRRM